jgi:hypothetical protein
VHQESTITIREGDGHQRHVQNKNSQHRVERGKPSLFAWVSEVKTLCSQAAK